MYHRDTLHPYWGENFTSVAEETVISGSDKDNKKQKKRLSRKWAFLLKTPINFFKDFCNETSIHGFNHIVAPNRHPFEKVAWFVATLLAGLGALQLCLQQWQRYVASPVVVALEKDYRTWNNSFMAITVCQNIKYDNNSVQHYIEHRWNLKPGQSKYDYYFDFITMVTNASLDNLNGYIPYKDDPSLQDINLFELSVEVSMPLSESVAWFDKTVNVSFVNVMTDRGICHTINSIVSIDQAVDLPRSLNPKPNKDVIICSYFTTPCYLRLELEYIVTTDYYHSAYEIVDVLTDQIQEIGPGTDYSTDWKMVETKASKDIKDLKIGQRKCRFHDEPMKNYHKVYTNNICVRECRNRLAVKYCGCRPYFYFQEEYKMCGVAGMACLSQYTAKIIQYNECNCLPQCIDSFYEMASDKKLKWGGPFRYRSALKVAILPPRSKYTRQILFYFEDLVVSFGGAAGLFLGCSFLSGVEILYFILSKLTSPIASLFGHNKRKVDLNITDNTRQRNTIDVKKIQQISEQMPHYSLSKFINETVKLEK